MQFEYPFCNYNLFQYIYVLFFYSEAKNDYRFLEAFNLRKGKHKITQIVVERVLPELGKLSFCKNGKEAYLRRNGIMRAFLIRK